MERRFLIGMWYAALIVTGVFWNSASNSWIQVISIAVSACSNIVLRAIYIITFLNQQQGQRKTTATIYEVIAEELRKIIRNFGCLAINHRDMNIIERNRK